MVGRSNKRRVDVVDLTQNDQENASRPSKLMRNDRMNAALANVSNGQRFGESTAYISFSQRDDDETGVDDLVQSSQSVSDLDISAFQIYGSWECVFIVAMLALVNVSFLGESPPTNTTQTLLRVKISEGVGRLATNDIQDDKSLVMEGMLTGSIGAYDCPIAITLFGPTNPVLRDRTKNRMLADRLPITELIRTEQDKARNEWQRKRALQEAENKKRVSMNGQSSGLYPNLSTPKGIVDPTNLEDLLQQSSSININRMSQAVEKFGITESDLANMPMAEIPIAMNTQLLSYQRQGLAWMLEKESPKLPEAGADHNVQLWKKEGVISEYDPNKKAAKTTRNGLYSIQWRRVVLDEGHTIRNPHTKGALAACHFKANSRWTLTGTPIINSLKDLYSQIRFLRLSGGLEELSMFNAVLIRPLSSGNPAGATLLQALMKAICLRRRKDMSFVNLRLPPMKMHVLRVKFHPHEQEKYDMFSAEAQGTFDKYRSSGPNGRTTYSHVLEVLLRMRQVCNHWALCKNRVDKLMAMLEKDKVVELTPENIKALQDMLQVQIESQETCAICLDSLSEPVITACAHAFDKACITQVIERQHKCPLCRAEIKEANSLVSPATELGEDAGAVEVDASAPSSKIEALVKILAAKGQTKGTKTVVFSQWTSFLDVVEPHLTQNGIRFTRIDGKLNSNNRDQAIAEFTTDPSCTVLLASLNVCSVGLNLVAANQVVLCDSWWAPAIEDQAIDRVYRLGQTRETTVWRLVMDGSVEDQVLEIQENKRALSSTALSEAGHKKGESTNSRLADLEKLLRKKDS
ncbi:hypothetical protein UA08_00214 [Talaromyces atroroseus]|uniref:Helicase-like transcription factor n=1 Tax=Talaromyces atroroseus TaxID=1441469 RepID=A0A225AS60_TALAT|nr:hypothetical protein UA08_00214 [Talaromyces atroroseus]OKL63830.1 hypothetical protein UA08_00214 [Talaromyces atroroseus]